MAPRVPATAIPPADGDEGLLIEAAKADPRRFAELYERHFDRVYAFIARRVGGRSEAEDLTAEVFHSALADRWHRTARESEQPPVMGEVDDHAQVERRAMISEFVRHLPADQQRVIVQRFVEQKSIREIARDLCRTEGAVKQLQFRALESLRSRMRSAHE